MPRRSLPLDVYQAKRDFSRTEEPAGQVDIPAPAPARGRRYVVQKHDARRLHFDFRLELDGVLKSWAVTRGPSLDPADKRLAVRTEDHPVEYQSFEGTIPKSEYGGGTVMLWDRGTWEPEGDPHLALESGLLKFELCGERLRGGFALVRLGKKPRDMRENWLLIKERDAYAERDGDAAERWRSSVATGRQMEGITAGQMVPAQGVKRGRRTPRRSRQKTAAGGTESRDGDHDRSSARQLRPPAFVTPQLATLASEPPQGEEWLHEIKYDGYRALAAVAGGSVRIFTRSGLDWTDKFPSIAEALSTLGLKRALLDGEIVVLDAAGRSNFGLLQRAIKDGSEPLIYYVFDLPIAGDCDLRREPLIARKDRLQRLLTSPPAGIRFSAHIAGQGMEVLAKVCGMGLEGIVSKRADSRYHSARTQSWIKVKCIGRDEFVVVGYRRSRKKGRPFSSLILGEYAAGALRYRGRVGTGFDDAELHRLEKQLLLLSCDTPCVVDPPREIARDARWVRPELVVEVSYTERTADGVLRHPAYVGQRGDKRAMDVVMAERRGKATTREGSSASVDGVRLTNPDKVLFSRAGLTKKDLANYLARVADLLLPHVRGRPLSFYRCPEGDSHGCFFQKHHTPGLPSELASVPVLDGDGETATYVGINSAEGLIAAAQVGALELHIWGARVDAIERPDRIVLDLDPDEDLPFSEVRRAARDVHDLLRASGLETFPMLTGGKGIHVVAPIERRHDWAVVKRFTHGFARRLAADDPDRFVVSMAKAKRRGRIFIDYLRNERGATAIAPYSLRAKPTASVAMPVTWDELRRIERADQFTMRSVLARIGQRPAAWGDYFQIRQRIPASALRFFA
ncbi:MAG: DNA ligase D [Hyphomicrobium sp.]